MEGNALLSAISLYEAAKESKNSLNLELTTVKSLH